MDLPRCPLYYNRLATVSLSLYLLSRYLVQSMLLPVLVFLARDEDGSISLSFVFELS